MAATLKDTAYIFDESISLDSDDDTDISNYDNFVKKKTYISFCRNLKALPLMILSILI